MHVLTKRENIEYLYFRWTETNVIMASRPSKKHFITVCKVLSENLKHFLLYSDTL